MVRFPGDQRRRVLIAPKDIWTMRDFKHRKIVAFEVSGCCYAIPLANARELLRMASTVPLPRVPSIVEGVINIRGRVVPVLDIRKRFRLPAKAPEVTDHLVVAQVENRLIALRVDRAVGLLNVDVDDIENAATVTPQGEYFSGVAKLPDGLVLIHDLSTFLADSESRDLDTALDSAKASLL